MNIIDFHAHLDDRWLGTPLPSCTAFLAGMDMCGVQSACVFSVMGLYEDCPGANDRLLAAVQAAPERLYPFAVADPKQGAAGVEEVARCLANPLFRGVKMHPWLQAFAPAMVKESTVAIARCAASHGVPVVLHDGTPPYATTFQAAALARWVPEATIIAGHAGLSDYVHAAGRLARELANLHLCFCGPKAGELGYLIEAAGVEKVLFGSDFGAATWPILAERIDAVAAASLGAEALAAVLYGNAARLLATRCP